MSGGPFTTSEKVGGKQVGGGMAEGKRKGLVQFGTFWVGGACGISG